MKLILAVLLFWGIAKGQASESIDPEANHIATEQPIQKATDAGVASSELAKLDSSRKLVLSPNVQTIQSRQNSAGPIANTHRNNFKRYGNLIDQAANTKKLRSPLIRRKMADETDSASGNTGIVRYDSYVSNLTKDSSAQNPVSMEQQIQEALQKAGPTPTIVIVNQTPTESIVVPDNDPIIEKYLGDDNFVVTPYNPYEGVAQQDPNNKNSTTFMEIDALITLVGGIGQIVDEIYTLIPDQDESAQRLKNTDSASVLNQAANWLKFYAKVRTFVQKVVERRDELIQNLLFLKNNVMQFRVSQQDMLRFYGLDERYYNVRLQCKPYEEKDIKFQAYWLKIMEFTDDYEESINGVLTEVRKLENAVMQLLNQISLLDETHYESTALTIIAKFDQTIMILAQFIELKETIEESVANLKTDFINIKAFRGQISASIDAASQLGEFYRIGQSSNGEISKGASFGLSALRIMMTITTVVLLI